MWSATMRQGWSWSHTQEKVQRAQIISMPTTSMATTNQRPSSSLKVSDMHALRPFFFFFFPRGSPFNIIHNMQWLHVVVSVLDVFTYDAIVCKLNEEIIVTNRKINCENLWGSLHQSFQFTLLDSLPSQWSLHFIFVMKWKLHILHSH